MFMPCMYCAIMLRGARTQWPENSLTVVEGDKGVCRIVRLPDGLAIDLRGEDAKRYDKLVEERLALIKQSQLKKESSDGRDALWGYDGE